MTSYSIKIFLLTTVDGKEKIVWADDEEDARVSANKLVLKNKTPGERVEYTNQDDLVYSNPLTKCTDITSQIEDLYTSSSSSVHFKFRGKNIHLGKGTAERLDKFQK